MSAAPLTVGVDLGGTKVEVALVDAQGRVLHARRRPTPQDPQSALELIAAQVRAGRQATSSEIAALGLGIAGQVDMDTGTLYLAPNLGWRDLPLGRRLQEALELPVVVANDVDAAAWGEYRHGAGRDAEDVACIFLGTGLGTGIIQQGRLLVGCGTSALEFGHVPVAIGGRRCSCPHRGCLEAYVGGWAIAERLQEVARARPDEVRLLLELAGSAEALRAEHLAQALERGDPFARAFLQETAGYLEAGLVGLVNVFAPCVLVLGGGVIEGLPELFQLATAGLARKVFPAFAQRLRPARAALGAQAGVIGAATLARDRFSPPG